LLSALRDAQQLIESIATQTPCTLCSSYSEGFCRQWKAQVPQDARERGCAEFEECPF
jgi:hypothetical protein